MLVQCDTVAIVCKAWSSKTLTPGSATIHRYINIHETHRAHRYLYESNQILYLLVIDLSALSLAHVTDSCI